MYNRLDEIKKQHNNAFRKNPHGATLHPRDVEWLIEQAEKVEQQQQEIKMLQDHAEQNENDFNRIIQEQQQEIEHLRDMLERARNHSRDRRKEVKVLQNANWKHKQEIDRLKYWEADGKREIAWYQNKSKALEQELEQLKKGLSRAC